LALLSGEKAAYEQQRVAICESSGRKRESIADACMMLGAAQLMHVVAADLKPLREPIDKAAKNVNNVSSEELIDVGAFYWDMHRVKLIYPAYRMHGSKFGKELLLRVRTQLELMGQYSADPQFERCLLWLSERRFWSDGYAYTFPDSLEVATYTSPMIAAAQVNGLVSLKWLPTHRSDLYEERVKSLRESAKTEKCSYYRYWFESLAEELEEKIVGEQDRFGGPSCFGRWVDEDDEDEDEDYCDW